MSFLAPGGLEPPGHDRIKILPNATNARLSYDQPPGGTRLSRKEQCGAKAGFSNMYLSANLLYLTSTRPG